MPSEHSALKTQIVPEKTLVRPDSEKNLPTNLDREKERALPPGAATPGGPSDSENEAGGGRLVPKFEENTPDNGIPERPRTLPTPGEEYGHPTKYDYNHVTRRPDVMASAIDEDGDGEGVGVEDGLEDDIEASTKEAYTRRWRPGQRQRKQRSTQRRKSKIRYRKNRNKYKQKARRRYKQNRGKTQFKAQQRHRRRYPGQHKRKRASAEAVATMFLEGWESGPIFPEERQRKQRGIPKSKSRAYYRRNRAERMRNALRRYHQFCKRDRDCKRKREEYRKDPKRFQRRGSVLTTPQISFVIGPDFLPGSVRNISSMTGIVTFLVDVKDIDPLQSMGLVAFLQSVVFLSDDDIEAMFNLIDVEIGEEAYQDIDEDVVRECAEQYDIDVDAKEFADHCMGLVGETDFTAMTPAQLEDVNDRLVLNVLEGGGWPRGTDDNDPDDEGPDDEYDWHLYYGEVPNPDRQWTDEDLKAAADIFQYDQKAPQKQIDYPGKDVDYTPTSPENYAITPDDEEGVPPGTTAPDQHLDDASPASNRVVPPGDGKLYEVDLTYLASQVASRHLEDERLRETHPMTNQEGDEEWFVDGVEGQRTRKEITAATIAQIASRTGPEVHTRARGLRARLRRADPKRGIWTFEVRGSSGTYRVRVKGIRKGNIKNLSKAQVQVSCTCPFWQWQGPEHWAKANKYLYGSPRGTASKPDVKDPGGKHWACKHVLAALRLARKYRFGSSGLGQILDAEIIPVPEELMMANEMAERVAQRHLEAAKTLELMLVDGIEKFLLQAVGIWVSMAQKQGYAMRGKLDFVWQGNGYGHVMVDLASREDPDWGLSLLAGLDIDRNFRWVLTAPYKPNLKDSGKIGLKTTPRTFATSVLPQQDQNRNPIT